VKPDPEAHIDSVSQAEIAGSHSKNDKKYSKISQFSIDTYIISPVMYDPSVILLFHVLNNTRLKNSTLESSIY
jgi:hypothetical protein